MLAVSKWLTMPHFPLSLSCTIERFIFCFMAWTTTGATKYINVATGLGLLRLDNKTKSSAGASQLLFFFDGWTADGILILGFLLLSEDRRNRNIDGLLFNGRL